MESFRSATVPTRYMKRTVHAHRIMIEWFCKNNENGTKCSHYIVTFCTWYCCCLQSFIVEVLAAKRRVLHEETQLFRRAYANKSVFRETLLKAQKELDVQEYKEFLLGNQQTPTEDIGKLCTFLIAQYVCLLCETSCKRFCAINLTDIHKIVNCKHFVPYTSCLLVCVHVCVSAFV